VRGLREHLGAPGGVDREAREARAALWQRRLDGPVVAAAVAAIPAVGLQLLGNEALHDAGLALSWIVWFVFLADAAIMLTVHPRPAAWARSHAFELVVVLVAFPLWPLVRPGLLAAEVLPAFTLLEATKLAKLAKTVRVLRRRA
jgi:hypothetical protein